MSCLKKNKIDYKIMYEAEKKRVEILLNHIVQLRINGRNGRKTTTIDDVNVNSSRKLVDKNVSFERNNKDSISTKDINYMYSPNPSIENSILKPTSFPQHLHFAHQYQNDTFFMKQPISNEENKENIPNNMNIIAPEPIKIIKAGNNNKAEKKKINPSFREGLFLRNTNYLIETFKEKLTDSKTNSLVIKEESNSNHDQFIKKLENFRTKNKELSCKVEELEEENKELLINSEQNKSQIDALEISLNDKNKRLEESYERILKL